MSERHRSNKTEYWLIDNGSKEVLQWQENNGDEIGLPLSDGENARYIGVFIDKKPGRIFSRKHIGLAAHGEDLKCTSHHNGVKKNCTIPKNQRIVIYKIDPREIEIEPVAEKEGNCTVVYKISEMKD